MYGPRGPLVLLESPAPSPPVLFSKLPFSTFPKASHTPDLGVGGFERAAPTAADPREKLQRGVAPPWGAASTAFTGNASAGFYGTVEVDVACWNRGRMASTSCAWCVKRRSENKNREEKPVHVSQSQPRDARKGSRAGNIVNSSKSAWPPWAIGTPGSSSPQSPSTAFKASVLHVSQGFPHAGAGGRRIHGPEATCADPGRRHARYYCLCRQGGAIFLLQADHDAIRP